MSKIKEPKLQEYKDYIDKILELNNLESKCMYSESTKKDENSMLSYLIGTKFGIVCHIKDTNKFGGAILKNHILEYHDKEGFSDEFINENVDTYSVVDNIQLFLPVMLYPRELILE